MYQEKKRETQDYTFSFYLVELFLFLNIKEV